MVIAVNRAGLRAAHVACREQHVTRKLERRATWQRQMRVGKLDMRQAPLLAAPASFEPAADDRPRGKSKFMPRARLVPQTFERGFAELTQSAVTEQRPGHYDLPFRPRQRGKRRRDTPLPRKRDGSLELEPSRLGRLGTERAQHA